ncbi:hypothetical protein RUND412_008554 [Rhizina undulata]
MSTASNNQSPRIYPHTSSSSRSRYYYEQRIERLREEIATSEANFQSLIEANMELKREVEGLKKLLRDVEVLNVARKCLEAAEGIFEVVGRAVGNS